MERQVLRNAAPIRQEEVLLSWARAEIPSRWRAEAPPHREKVEAGIDLCAREVADVVAFIRCVRDDVDYLLDGRASWYRADMRIADLGALELDAFWIWSALGAGGSEPWREPHARTIAELAAHVDAPPPTLEGEFEVARMRGAPILIGSRMDGPLRVVEGSNRSRALWNDFVHSRGAVDSIEVLVGLHPEPEGYKVAEGWLALARIGWRSRRGGAFVARNVDGGRPHAAACPSTRTATAISEAAFRRMRALGVPEAPTQVFGSPPWAWTWVE